MPLIGAEYEDLRLAVAIPVRNCQVANARQRGESHWGGKGAVRLLEVDGNLAAIGLGDQQIGQAIAIDIGPQQAAAGPLALVERPDLELALAKSAGERLRRLAGELGNLRPARVLCDGDHLYLLVLLQVVRPIGTNWRG